MSDVSNSFSAWATMLEDDPPLCIAVRRPKSPPPHYEAVNHRGGRLRFGKEHPFIGYPILSDSRAVYDLEFSSE
ncbi:hypothetical protein RB195_023076 [Necator americanus]|uniref:Uncharacterized protein n=1 Tax=Necator americanus TaxID=51031 RepID=A0ABR1EHR9_NECAM